MFDLIDKVRRQAGFWFDIAEIGKRETPFRIAAELEGAFLRAYCGEPGAAGPVLLIVPAPFKRPYIWDLRPDISVVKACLAEELRVYLLDWTTPGAREDELGLGHYAKHLIDKAIDRIEAETGETETILAGNSLGGTFAAIFASMAPERVRGLALMDAPLAFGEVGGRLAHLARTIPDVHLLRQMLGSPVRGSALDLLSIFSVPEVFLWQRYGDLASSMADADTMDLHLRVMRWTLDEFPLPGRLFEEIIIQLYREDRFMRGILRIGGRTAAVRKLRSPVFAVLNPTGDVVPPASVETALRTVPGLAVRTFIYEEQVGTVIQHVGPLVSHFSRERIWPAFFTWAREIEEKS